jgi:hypothetical protein
MSEQKQYTGKNLKYYDGDFYTWTIDQALADARDLYICDVDAVVRDRRGNLRLLEIKRNDFDPKPYQERNIAILDAIIRQWQDITGGELEIEIGGRIERHTIAYHGFNVLRLSNESFYTSTFTLDGEPITGEALADLLRFNCANVTQTSR